RSRGKSPQRRVARRRAIHGGEPRCHQLRSDDRGPESVHPRLEDELSALPPARSEHAAPRIQVRAVLGRTGVRPPSQAAGKVTSTGRVTMRERFVALVRVAPAIIAALGLAATPAQAQIAAPSAAAKAPAKAGSTFKTPWGDPDLQGAWSNATTTPMQRPAKWAGKEVLTKEEIAELDRETDLGTDKRPERGTAADVGGAYNRFWWDRGFSDGRTSLIYDPADGRIPALTPEGQKRRRNRSDDDESYNGPEDLPLYTRCVIRAPLPRVPTGYDNNYEIVQAPGYIAIFQEQM